MLLFGVPSSAIEHSFVSNNTLYSVQTVIAAVLITVGIIMHICLQKWYFRDRKRENPIKLIINVLYYSATVERHLPIRNQAFRRGEERKSRIELAKIEYDGIFTSEEVENVKTFCQILFLILTLGGCFATYGGVRI